MKKEARLEVRLDTDLHAKLDELAKLRGVKASVVVRRSILDAHRAAFPNASRSHPPLAVPDAPLLPLDSVASFHERLWGSPPSDIQAKLYAAHARGYLAGATEEQVDAVLTTALFIAPLRPYDPTNIPAQPDAGALLPVAVLAPPELGTLVDNRAVAAFAASRGKPDAKIVGQTIGRMKRGLPPQWGQEEPRIWIAVGLVVDDTTPRWLRRRLIEVAA
jgi:hypothetical protein